MTEPLLTKLELSTAIDRGGAGEIPDVSSISFRRVQTIPRGPASRTLWGWYGGAPQCPVCRKSSAITRNGSRFRRKHAPASSFLGAEGFHCNRCRTWWTDTDDVTCFVCEAVFIAEPDRGLGRCSKYAGTCYHYNVIEHPFCKQCESIVGDGGSAGRRQLRRLVGLRKRASAEPS